MGLLPSSRDNTKQGSSYYGPSFELLVPVDGKTYLTRVY